MVSIKEIVEKSMGLPEGSLKIKDEKITMIEIPTSKSDSKSTEDKE